MQVTQIKEDEISFFGELKDQKYAEFGEHFYEEIFDLLMPSPVKNKIVLDAGCASGAWGIRLARRGYFVVGV